LNTDLAFVSLFPLGALDGKKVIDWDKRIWSIVFAVTLALWMSLVSK